MKKTSFAVLSTLLFATTANTALADLYREMSNASYILADGPPSVEFWAQENDGILACYAEEFSDICWSDYHDQLGTGYEAPRPATEREWVDWKWLKVCEPSKDCVTYNFQGIEWNPLQSFAQYLDQGGFA